MATKEGVTYLLGKCLLRKAGGAPCLSLSSPIHPLRIQVWKVLAAVGGVGKKRPSWSLKIADRLAQMGSQ